MSTEQSGRRAHLRSGPGPGPARVLRRLAVLSGAGIACLAILLLLPERAYGQPDPPETPPGPASGSAPQAAEDASAPPPVLAIELNKLQQQGDACTLYLVFRNRTRTPIESLKLELVLFDREGIVARRLTLDAAPLGGARTAVKLFDLAATRCDRIGRVLANDLPSLATAAGPIAGGLERVSLASKVGVDFFK